MREAKISTHRHARVHIGLSASQSSLPGGQPYSSLTVRFLPLRFASYNKASA